MTIWDCWNKSEESELPPEEAVYIQPNKNDVWNDTYHQAQYIWRSLRKKSMGDYRYIHLQTNTFILTDILKNLKQFA
jgi:hypothetical protein